MLRNFFVTLLFSIAFQSCIYSQVNEKIDVAPETKAEKAQEKKPYSLSQFGHESYLALKQPTLWKRSDWLKLGIVTAGVLAVMPFDQAMMNATQGEQRYYYSVGVVGGRVYGEWYTIGSVFGAFGLYGIVAKDTAAKKVAIELLQAGIYSELVTMMLKMVIGRARPISGENSFSYKPFTLLNDNFHSLPSGHATSSMALSTVMSRHAHSTALKILAYVPAGFTLFSRIYQNKHWMSDELLGAAIGYFVGNWVVDLHEGKRHRINVTALYPTTVITYSFNQVRPKKKLPEIK